CGWVTWRTQASVAGPVFEPGLRPAYRPRVVPPHSTLTAR
ncbi:MAG: hypothetical protein AVDCRST_MAG01-01-414, partial [uncultured Rubrobacteraceae bacterium]